MLAAKHPVYRLAVLLLVNMPVARYWEDPMLRAALGATPNRQPLYLINARVVARRESGPVQATLAQPQTVTEEKIQQLEQHRSSFSHCPSAQSSPQANPYYGLCSN